MLAPASSGPRFSPNSSRTSSRATLQTTIRTMLMATPANVSARCSIRGDDSRSGERLPSVRIERPATLVPRRRKTSASTRIRAIFADRPANPDQSWSLRKSRI